VYDCVHVRGLPSARARARLARDLRGARARRRTREAARRARIAARRKRHRTDRRKRLAEAQQAPAIVENILGLVSGQDIVGHEQLVKLLGNAYMVDLFRCGDQMACLVAHLKPLQQAGYRTAVYGSY